MVKTEVSQKVQLMNCSVTPLEASDVLKNFIDEAINFNKKSRLKQLISDENCDTSEFCDTIDALSQERRYIKQMIDEARKAGLNLSVKANFEISIVE